jgi:hypothetical protein
MIVGLYTYKNARLQESHTLGGGISGYGGTDEVKAGVNTSGGTNRSFTFTAADKSIFALEYRKVKRQWLSKAVDKATLEQGNQWEVLWGMRSKSVKDISDEKKIVEVFLIDEDAEDVEEPQGPFEIDDDE